MNTGFVLYVQVAASNNFVEKKCILTLVKRKNVEKFEFCYEKTHNCDVHVMSVLYNLCQDDRNVDKLEFSQEHNLLSPYSK